MDKNKKPIPLITNRRQKRQAEKALKINGKTKEEINLMIDVINKANLLNMDDMPKFKEYLLEGDKVKLNIEQIKSYSNWAAFNPQYREFVENNTDVIFTVEYDKTHEKTPFLVCLKEDTGEPKFLWWDGDLLVLDEKDGVFKKLYTVTEDES